MAVLHHSSKELLERTALSIVESGYEPEIFKSAFQTWENFDHSISIVSQTIEEDSDEAEEKDEEEMATAAKTVKSSGAGMITSNKRSANLLPENIWIN